MNRLMRRTTAMLFPRSNRADTDDHRDARGTQEVAQGTRARGTTTAGLDDDQAPTSSTNSARATGQRGYSDTIHAFSSRLSRLLHPRRQGSFARELRALVQIQREQADDLRGLARNSDQLASLCVLQGMPTAPLPSRPGSPIWTFERLGDMWPDLARQFWESRLTSGEGSLAETIRSSLRAGHGSFASNSSDDAIAPSAPAAFAAAFGSSGHNVRGSRVSAPAVLGQAHAEASPDAPRNTGDEDEDSSESFYTPRQSFSDDRDDASLNDGSTRDSSSASENELVHSPLPSADNTTFAVVNRIDVASEAFSGVRLVIEAGERQALGAASIAFDYALPCLVSRLKQDGHALTQLHIILYHAAVRGGSHSGQDALVAILKRARDYLQHVLSVQVTYVEKDHGLTPEATQLVKPAIQSAFRGLHRLRIEGRTVSSRVNLFPLHRLRHLEIAMNISEADVKNVMHSCPLLDVLFVSSAHSALSRFLLAKRNSEAREDLPYPMVLRLNGDHFGPDLLQSIPPYIDLRLTVSPSCPHLAELSHFLDSRENARSPLRVNSRGDAGSSR
ncbi:hypothetical protein EV122DRAFT_254460 [Schizophyllum commune]